MKKSLHYIYFIIIIFLLLMNSKLKIVKEIYTSITTMNGLQEIFFFFLPSWMFFPIRFVCVADTSPPPLNLAVG